MSERPSHLVPNVFLGSILIALTTVITLGLLQVASLLLAV